MKKFLSIILAVLTLLSTIIINTGCDACDKAPQEENKNVILFIGDGMGENHVLNAITYFELDNPAFIADKKYYSMTNSLSGTTDSAAGATALSTGQKVYNSYVAKTHMGKNITSISELAKKAGKKVGIVTTDNLYGATPAGFSAHANERTETDIIINSQSTSNVDLFIGKTDADDNYCTTNADIFTAKGYQLASSYDEMLSAQNADKLLATLPKMYSKYGAGANGHIQLDDLVSFAVEFLENDNGFFLMVEGAYIDKFSHSNDIVNALAETRSFFDAISIGYAYADANTNTTVIITADHETGALALAQDKSSIQNLLYSSTGHSSANVPIYIKNFEYFSTDNAIENTEIFTICKSALGLN